MKKGNRFGTFQGVFTPTVLTILGVIMYIRLPWVVGNGGIIGALLIVVMALMITLFTALSMSSMTTNIRIGSGGPFSIIAQSLGLEIGGSIGIPLYFSQAFAVAMYIFGFREGWLWIFPDHPAILIDLATFTVVGIVAMISTDFAFKIQYVIMAVILGSIVSIVGGLWDVRVNLNEVQWIGDFSGAFHQLTMTPEESQSSAFWIVFAVFFPAVTGIMAGANMSGDLKNPRISIPKGTISAIVLSGLVYIGLVFVAALLANPDTLISNYNVFIDQAWWGPIVVGGLLGACFSSALSSLVGSSRILLALSEKNIVPGSGTLKKVDTRGEPRTALVFTVFVVILSLFLRDLNAIAPLITMFFLITYTMINVVVLLEQSLSLPSFRPTFKVALLIPMIGAIGCIIVMFIINAVFSLIALGVVITVYAVLLRRELTSDKADARSGLFTSIAEWATKQSNELSPKKEARSWQPELLVPVESPKEIRGAYRLIYAITHPKGSVKLLGMQTGEESHLLGAFLPGIAQTFRKANIIVSYSMLEGDDFGGTVRTSMQALESAFFKPNTIFLKLADVGKKEEKYMPVIQACKSKSWGLLLFVAFEQVGLGIEKTINIWLDTIPADWEESMDLGNNDLAILIGMIIRGNWNARIRLIKTLRQPLSEEDPAIQKSLQKLRTLARFPKNTEISIVARNPDMWQKVPPADLNILELPRKDDLDLKKLMEIPEKLRGSCLFTLDSNIENALV